MMELRLQAIEQRKGMYCSIRGLDLGVITAGEEDEESQTRGDDSFVTLESEYDSESEDEAEGGSFGDVSSCPKAPVPVD